MPKENIAMSCILKIYWYLPIWESQTIEVPVEMTLHVLDIRLIEHVEGIE